MPLHIGNLSQNTQIKSSFNQDSFILMNSYIIYAMADGQDLNRIQRTYDTVAKEYAEVFFGEHEKKPKDQEILHRFAQEIGDRKPVWDFGCGPGQTTKYLKNLGIEISGLDLSEKTVNRQEQSTRRYTFKREIFLNSNSKTTQLPVLYLSTL